MLAIDPALWAPIGGKSMAGGTASHLLHTIAMGRAWATQIGGSPEQAGGAGRRWL
jgi:hypothetical protein